MQHFEYLQPKTIEEASKFSGEDWQNSLLFAGGTDVLGMVKNRIQSPQKVVNLKSVPGLDSLTYTPGKGLRMGTLVRISTIAEHPVIRQKYPVLAQAAKQTASPQLRNMGTIGGNLCQRPRCWYFRGEFQCLRKGGDMCYAVEGENKYHCIVGGGPCFIVHPSDSAVALLALDGSVTIASGKKNRQIPLREFFILPQENVRRENILKPGEIITEIHLPAVSENTVSGYIKFSEREVWDFAVVSVAAVIQKMGNRIKTGKIAFGGVAPKPWLDEYASQALNGFTPSEDTIKQLSQQALRNAEPLEHNRYKRPLAQNLLKRLLTGLTLA